VVCSQFAREPDFVRAYRTELLRHARVRPAGFLDIRSERFRALQAGCGAVLLPSCAEAQCGSLVVAMAFGLPVVMSRACDLDEPSQTTLADCSVETIRAAVAALCDRGAAEVRAAADAAGTAAQERYRPEHYRRSVDAALDAVLAARSETTR
jgi:glycosyltransferase involved in cell wall biosynthesis